MSNVKCPMTKEIPMPNIQENRLRHLLLSLAIGHSLGICHWPLEICRATPCWGSRLHTR
jgi:hypothetical protein